MNAHVPVRRALLSVSDKTGLVEFAGALAAMGVELISTGGTARTLKDAGVSVRLVEELTGFPEIMGGRVKTLHPLVHSGILALRADADHERAMRDHGVRPIDLVCVNLYPFEETIARQGVSPAEAVEQIDVGGPAMARAAAKNHEWVVAVTSPAQYGEVVEELKRLGGATSRPLRERLAAEAFARVSAYDAAIAAFLGRHQGIEPSSHPVEFPSVLAVAMPKVMDLRYGENPHQRAALYADPARRGPSVARATQLHGRELSYNNIADAAAALGLVMELSRVSPGGGAAAIVKHANPCGAAVGPTAEVAVDLALRGDAVAAYGGILALSARVDSAAADRLCAKGVFLEVIVAPEFDAAAAEQLRAKSANVRLLAVGDDGADLRPAQLVMKSIPGGMLAQSADDALAEPEKWIHAAGNAPSAERLREAAVVWTIAKHLSSNAVAIGGADAGGVRLFGAGAGQMDRTTACRLAAEKAGALARGAIAASDGFFPFPDGPALLIDAGVSLIVHPGGSKRDAETFDLCNRRGVACMTTGVRHFRH